MKRNYTRIRIEQSVATGHAHWRAVRRRGTALPEPTLAEQLQQRWQRMVALLTAAWNRLSKKTAVAGALALGVFVGLVVLGWGLWPVEWDASTWDGATFHNLPEAKRALVLDNSADLFSYDTDQARVRALLADWPGAADDICRLAATAPDDAQRMRYEALLYITSGQMCSDLR